MFVTGRAGSLGVHTIRTDGTDERVVLENLVGFAPQLSPDRQAVALRTGRDELSVIQLDGSGQVVVASHVRSFTWAPDGKRIAYGSSTSVPQIYIVRRDGSGRRQITHRTRRGSRTFDPIAGLAWSPDGARIAVISQQTYDPAEPPNGGWLSTVTPDGRHEARLPKLGGFVPATIAWAPGGRQLAVSSFRDAGVTVVAPDRGVVTFLHGTDCCVGLQSLAWSPNGRRLAFLGGDTSSSYTGGVTPVPNSRPTIFSRLDLTYDPAWSPAATQLAFVACHGEVCRLYIADQNGRHVTPITNTIDAYSGGQMIWTQ